MESLIAPNATEIIYAQVTHMNIYCCMKDEMDKVF